MHDIHTYFQANSYVRAVRAQLFVFIFSKHDNFRVYCGIFRHSTLVAPMCVYALAAKHGHKHVMLESVHM